MLRICLDVRNIKPVMTGLGRYALNLVKGIADLDSENEYILLKNPSYEGAIIDRPNFREELLAGDISSMRSVLLHGAVINRIEPDVYHTLMHCLPFGLHCPKVVLTLHDLIWVDYPRLAFTNRLKAFYNRHLKGRLIKYAVNRADMVIAISQATRERAIAVFRVPPSKCRLIYHGIEERFLNHHLQNQDEHKLTPELIKLSNRIGGRYIISLGHSKPYKNVPGVLRAFKLLCSKYPDLKLLIVGRGEQYPALRRLVEELQIGNRVIFWSSLTDSELTDKEIITLFRQAALLAFPSFVEGFGYPIVEAMAVGCPVVTSKVSAPKEIAANAAVLVDPHEVQSIAAGMDKLLTEPDLRQELIARGRCRAAEFTVERCAKATHALYTAPL